MIWETFFTSNPIFLFCLLFKKDPFLFAMDPWSVLEKLIQINKVRTRKLWIRKTTFRPKLWLKNVQCT